MQDVATCEYYGQSWCTMTYHGRTVVELRRIAKSVKQRPRNELRDQWLRTSVAS